MPEALPMRVVAVPCLTDNFAYLLIAGDGQTAIIDPSEADPVRAAIAREGAVPRAIWNTHHHWDHVGGNEALAKEHGLEVVAHTSDRGRLPGQTRGIEAGDTVRVGDIEARILHIPGHTLGAIAYVIGDGKERVVFTGDTLFSAGCGRLFEGTPALMHASLSKLAALPDDTRVYPGHEYTESNLRFAAHVEPSNPEIKRAQSRASTLRAKGEPTVGTTIAEERAYNPFLRTASAEIRSTLGIAPDASDTEALGAIRAAKDGFR
ncbi:MAG: hydroxyacylglutathione hydrolase [Polyangiaceae bacterium]|nr:hydroxyacylglutathione hydrolase [Polyangiaceae bacterium]